MSSQDVTIEGRTFSVIRTGRRWTKVPEYMSNGQRTARWFVDEATREVRVAKSWRSPQPYPMPAGSGAFVLSLIALADSGVTSRLHRPVRGLQPGPAVLLPGDRS